MTAFLGSEMDSMIKRAADDLARSGYAIALSGAGMSTESGIADFRGPRGIWTTDRKAEAEAYQRYDLFLRDPRAYWEGMLGVQGRHGAFYDEIRKSVPNPGHYALAELEALGRLKCAITQNIDGLHVKAGSRRVIEYHGSIHRLRCIACGSRFAREEVSLDELPPRCSCGAALKYDVVHFKEAIPFDVMEEAEREALRCDLMLVCGTSAVVYPFAGLPRIARFGARRSLLGLGTIRRRPGLRVIEVNAESTPLTDEGVSDYLIQGKTGEILPRIAAEVRKARSAFAGEHNPLLGDQAGEAKREQG